MADPLKGRRRNVKRWGTLDVRTEEDFTVLHNATCRRCGRHIHTEDPEQENAFVAEHEGTCPYEKEVKY